MDTKIKLKKHKYYDNEYYNYNVSECNYFYCGQCDICNEPGESGDRELDFSYIVKAHFDKCFYKCDECEAYKKIELTGINTELSVLDKPCFFIKENIPDYLKNFAVCRFTRNYVYLIYVPPNCTDSDIGDVNLEDIVDTFHDDYKPTQSDIDIIESHDILYSIIREIKDGSKIIIKGTKKPFNYDINSIESDLIEVIDT